MATYLDAIVERHRRASGSGPGVSAEQAAHCPPTRGFADALRGARGIAAIAEIKRRSPSRGDLAPDLDPASLAAEYEAHGARCLSVLTDTEFFGGSADDLVAARSACALPVLRKDFTVRMEDVYAARLMGADALLLIVAALDRVELRDLFDAGVGVDLDVLVEVHDEAELEDALDVGATLVGVNQRDLHSFDVDRTRARRVRAEIPEGVLSVAESGIRSRADVSALEAAGFDAILVGEALVTADSPGAALGNLIGSESTEAVR